MSDRICVVVVTYNRKDLLLRNLMATLSQSVGVDVLIYDNHSTDGTREYLRENGILDSENIHYFYSDKNLGGAGGFSNGMRMVYEKGYDYAWLMDDDGCCFNEYTLKNLLDVLPAKGNPCILNPAVVCNDNLDLTFGFYDISTYSQLLEGAAGGVYDGYINPFNGTLVSRECMDLIGFPKGEFFIYGDEHEYMLRALKNNVLVRTAVNSLYFHPVNRTIKHKNVWKFSVPIKDEPVWKTFCDTRNSIYISKHYESPKMLIIRVLTSLLAALHKTSRKTTYLRYVIIAISDGLRGKFDRPIMFQA